MSKKKVPQVQFRADAIDEPVTTRTVEMLSALPPEEKLFYESEENVITWFGKSQTLLDDIQRCYGFFGGPEEEWIRYLHRPDVPEDMWVFAPLTEVKAVTGIAAVPKKRDGRQRKLLMACAANYVWCDVAERNDYGLLGGAALTGVRVPSDTVDMSIFDESNAFTAIRIPSWMWGWFSSPPFMAGSVWNLIEPSMKKDLSPWTWITAQYTRLPMGSSHSVHIIMAINLHTVGKSLMASANLSATALASKAAELAVEDRVALADRAYVTDAEWMTKQHHRRHGMGLGSGWTMATFREKAEQLRRDGMRVITVLHCFSGARRVNDIQDWVSRLALAAGVAVWIVSMDLAFDANWDLTCPHVMAQLLEIIALGFVDMILGGPPCATWSRVRFLCGGPPPLRHRGEFAWGLPWLTGAGTARVKEANLLLVNFLALCEAVVARGGGHLLEHPEDPGGPPYPSIWDTQLVLDWEKRLGSIRALLDQCMHGGVTRKPTCLSATLLGIEAGGVRCDGGHVHGRSTGLNEQGTFHTRALQSYPSGLCRFIAWCIIRTAVDMMDTGRGPTGWRRMGWNTRKVSTWSRRTLQPSDMATVVLNEQMVTGGHTVLARGQTALYMHVDDGVVLADASRPDLSNSLMHQLADALEDIGFEVPDRKEAAPCQVAVGYEVVSSPALVRLSSAKAHLLAETLRWLALAPWIDVELLRAVTGMWIWGSLVRRCLLSIPSSIFTLMSRFPNRVMPMWPSVRLEINMMAAAVAFLEADLGAMPAPLLFAADAEGANEVDVGGFGIVATTVSETLAEGVLDGYTRAGHTVASLDGSVAKLIHRNKELRGRVPISRVPSAILNRDAACWEAVDYGRWQWKDHIMLGEARASLNALERYCRFPQTRRTIIPLLEDNESWSAATAKGRSPNFRVNTLLRRKAALEIATQTEMILPWVDTANQPADYLSRLR